jgi:Domain of unknown function (DUF1929)
MPDRWQIVKNQHGHPLQADILMVHVALLPDGKVMAFAGSQHNMGYDKAKPFQSVLWDPDMPHHMTVLPAPKADLFCAGHCMLANGNVLAAGGTYNYDREPDNPDRPYHFTGISECFIFDWRNKTWSKAAPMTHARWYPTLLPLADGRVLAISGHSGPDLPSHEVLETEIYDPSADRWEPARATIPELEDTAKFWLFRDIVPMVYYTRLHGLADGRAFSSTALQVKRRRRTRVLDPVTNRLTTVGPAPRGMFVPFMRNVYSRANFTSVLLPLKPPDYPQHVLIAGGRTARRFDAGAAKGKWRRAGKRRPYKMRAYATGLLLPDGSVIVVGGGGSEKVARWYCPSSEVGGYDRDSNPRPERYFADTDTWVVGNGPTDYPPIPRMYHTAAVVLPSGDVLICGSNKDSQRNVGGGREDHDHHGEDARELRLETLTPSGMDSPTRIVVPAISPTSAGYGTPVIVQSPDAARIQRVTLLRNSTVTHAYSSDQRLLELVITARTAGSVTVTTPPTPQLAIPGYYLLFALDADGVPSRGQSLCLG